VSGLFAELRGYVLCEMSKVDEMSDWIKDALSTLGLMAFLGAWVFFWIGSP
jgi:hypothetical protein